MGRLTSTRTFTRYFGEDQTAELVRLVDELAADWDTRRPYIDSEIATEGDERIQAVRLTVARLADRAG